MSAIELKFHEGKYIPVLYCESCQRPIISVYGAMLSNNREGKSMLCHKGDCDPKWDGSIELRDILAQLVNNYMGVDMKVSDEGFSDIEVQPSPGFEEFVGKL